MAEQPTIKIVCPKCLRNEQRTHLEITMWEGIYTWTGATYCDGCKTRIVAEMEKCRGCGKPIDAMELCAACAEEISNMPLDAPGDWMRQDGSGRPF